MRRLEAWLFAPGDPRRLAVVRIGLCGLLAVRLATGPYAELASQPAALFRPISFLRLLERMPPRGLVVAVQALALAGAVLAAAGLWTRVALPLAWAGVPAGRGRWPAPALWPGAPVWARRARPGARAALAARRL